MGWLRLVGSLKLQVSFAEEPYQRDDILRERPIILRSLLIVATSYGRPRILQGKQKSESLTSLRTLCLVSYAERVSSRGDLQKRPTKKTYKRDHRLQKSLFKVFFSWSLMSRQNLWSLFKVSFTRLASCIFEFTRWKTHTITSLVCSWRKIRTKAQLTSETYTSVSPHQKLLGGGFSIHCLEQNGVFWFSPICVSWDRYPLGFRGWVRHPLDSKKLLVRVIRVLRLIHMCVRICAGVCLSCESFWYTYVRANMCVCVSLLWVVLM